MKMLPSLFVTALLVWVLPFGARAAVPDVPPIAAQSAQGTCEMCKRGGSGAAAMSHDMNHADKNRADMNHADTDHAAMSRGAGAMAGMSCCAGKRDGAAGGCERCRGGMDMDGMEMADMKMGGMGKACGGMQGMAAGDTAALERRIAELEKRLDLMQRGVTQSRTR